MFENIIIWVEIIEIGTDIKQVVCDSDRDSDKRSLVSLAGPATFRHTTETLTTKLFIISN